MHHLRASERRTWTDPRENRRICSGQSAASVRYMCTIDEQEDTNEQPTPLLYLLPSALVSES